MHEGEGWGESLEILRGWRGMKGRELGEGWRESLEICVGERYSGGDRSVA